MDGFAGLYVYDVATHHERLVAGGAGAGPLGYLHTATLSAGTDALDTFESARGSSDVHRGNGAVVVQSLRRTRGGRWEAVSIWLDSTGKETARQSVRTASGSLATELETVRATTDSASLLIARDRVTGWVVSQGRGPLLVDAAAVPSLFNRTMAAKDHEPHASPPSCRNRLTRSAILWYNSARLQEPLCPTLWDRFE